jgi:2-phospho-L-lactate guanylyltransferase
MPCVRRSRGSWALIVPVKRLTSAKTRLAVEEPLRPRFALAMALDTVRACLDCESVGAVVAVTDEPEAAEAVASLGALVVGDEPDAGLNPALRHGASTVARRHPGLRVAAVSSDLPALRGEDLESVLEAAASYQRACVADAAGVGTTLLAAASAERFEPSFGPGSLRAHLASGAVDLSPIAAPGLRRDVDTLDDLRAARRLGCGPATTALLAAAVTSLG